MALTRENAAPSEIQDCDSATRSVLRCPDCPQMAFNSKNQLVNHVQRWHSQDSQRFLCGVDGCPNVYVSTATRNLHRLRRHAANMRAHACTLCSFACAMRADLNQHLRRCHPAIAPPIQLRGKKKNDNRVPASMISITPLEVAIKRRAQAAAAPVVAPNKRFKARAQSINDDDDDGDDLATASTAVTATAHPSTATRHDADDWLCDTFVAPEDRDLWEFFSAGGSDETLAAAHQQQQQHPLGAAGTELDENENDNSQGNNNNQGQQLPLVFFRADVYDQVELYAQIAAYTHAVSG